MTYKELLRLYKEGKLNEQQRQQIEQDIQRQDAISEYLYEEGEIPGMEETVPFQTEGSEKEQSPGKNNGSVRNPFSGKTYIPDSKNSPESIH